MISWIRNYTDKRRRTVDLKILWPCCKEKAPNLELARAAFAFHVYQDEAWTRTYSEDEIQQLVNELN